MKIVKLMGGLGNQMFQYAFAKNLEKYFNEEVKLDDWYFQKNWNDGIRIERIKNFKLSIDFANEKEILKVMPFRRFQNNKNPIIQGCLRYAFGKLPFVCFDNGLSDFENVNFEKFSKYSYFDGYWNGFDFVNNVKDDLLLDFQPISRLSDKSQNAIEDISNENSVLVGVRRGDYLNKENQHLGVLEGSFFLRAMEDLALKDENLVFHVFSNDIKWCQETFEDSPYKIKYRTPDDITDDFEELFVMSACKHAVISNSTYHWWGAYLINDDSKRIIYPKPWHANGFVFNINSKNWIPQERDILVTKY